MSRPLATVDEATVRTVLERVFQIGDELDSNHARWTAGKVAEEYGIELNLPPIPEPNNVLRDQLRLANDEIARLEAELDDALEQLIGHEDPQPE